MDRLQALSIFKTVADKGGFARAAEALGLSCPHVSRSVQDLEALLGARLLQRTTRRVALTGVGREVLERVNGLLASYDELAAIGRASAGEPAGTVRMAAPEGYGRHVLGPVLAEFRARCPQVSIDLRLLEGPADLVGDEIDLALCLHEDLRPSFIARPVAEVEVGVYAAPSYLARRGEPAHPAELSAHECLTSGGLRAGASWCFRRLADGTRADVPVKAALRANHADLLADLAIHGAGVAMLPAFLVRDAVSQGRLQRLLAGWEGRPASLHLVYGPHRNQPVPVRRLIEHLLDRLGTKADARPAPMLHLVANDGDDAGPAPGTPAAAPRCEAAAVRLAA